MVVFHNFFNLKKTPLSLLVFLCVACSPRSGETVRPIPAGPLIILPGATSTANPKPDTLNPPDTRSGASTSPGLPVASASPSAVSSNQPINSPNLNNSSGSSGGGGSNRPGTTSATALWRESLAPGISIANSSPILHDGKLFLVSSAGYVNVLDAQTGELLWENRKDTSFESTPVLGPDGNLFTGGLDGSIYGFDSEGVQYWTYTPEEPNRFQFGGMALDENGILYAGGSSETLYAINTVTGEEVWRFEGRAPINNAPVITADRVYFLAMDQTLFALNRADGAYIWEYQTGKPIQNISPALGFGENIVFGSDDVWLYSVNRHGIENWGFQMRTGLTASPVIAADGTVYAGAGEVLYAVDSEGDLLWEQDLGSEIKSAPVLGDDGNIYVGTANGRIYSLFSDGSTEWMYQANGAIQGRLVMSDSGIVYGMTDKAQVVAIQSNSSGPAAGDWPMESGNARGWGRVN